MTTADTRFDHWYHHKGCRVIAEKPEGYMREAFLAGMREQQRLSAEKPEAVQLDDMTWWHASAQWCKLWTPPTQQQMCSDA